MNSLELFLLTRAIFNPFLKTKFVKNTPLRVVFQLSSRCFIWWWNTASHVWYITSNIRARVEAHTPPRLVGQFALLLSQPPVPNTLGAFFARARQDLRYKVLVLFLLFCVWKKCCHLIMEKRSSFVLLGSDIEDGMSSEMEKGSK